MVREEVMALDSDDKQLVSLLVSQQVREQLATDADALAEKVSAKLLSDSRIALFESQVKERTEKSVDASLKARYTFIGLATAAIVGGGSAAITQTFLSQINEKAAETLRENVAKINIVNADLSDLKQKISTALDQVGPIKEDAKQAQSTFKGADASIQAYQLSMTRTIQSVEKTMQTLTALRDEVNSLLPAGKSSSVTDESLKNLNAEISDTMAAIDANRFRIFLHFGSKDLQYRYENKMKFSLAEKGYVVVGSDVDSGNIGNSRIDYFFDSDCSGASAVQQLISGVFERRLLPLKLDLAPNSLGALGIWISKTSSSDSSSSTTCASSTVRVTK
jgi:hypothetical protein